MGHRRGDDAGLLSGFAGTTSSSKVHPSPGRARESLLRCEVSPSGHVFFVKDHNCANTLLLRPLAFVMFTINFEITAERKFSCNLERKTGGRKLTNNSFPAKLFGLSVMGI